MATPHLGLTIPVGGTTPGAANNTTPGTYPFIEAANLNLIDSLCFSPGNPVPTATAGLNINSNVNFNGFGISNASTASFSGAVGISGLLTLSGAGTALTIANNATVTGTLTVGTLALTNLSLSGTLGVTGTSTLGVVNASGLMALSAAGTSLTVVGAIAQSTASTPITISGNAPATASSGVILNNLVTLTTGNIASFQNNSVAKGSIDFAGKFLSNPGIFQAGVITTSATLKGTAGASGIATIMDGTVDVLGAGYITQFNALGTAQFAITGRGHLIPLSTTPTPSSFNAGFGTTSGVSLTGGDASFRINVTAGAGAAAIAANSVVCTIALAQAYASTNVSVMAQYGLLLGSSTEGSPLYANMISNSSMRIYNYAAFTPVSGNTYAIDVMTKGAGATF